MDSWRELSRIPNAIPTRRDPMPVSVVTAQAFDSAHDLFWSGDSTGRLASYYLGHHGLVRYTSFKAQPDAVIDLLTNPSGVISVSKDHVRLHNRRGIVKHNIEDPELAGLNAVAMSSKGTSEVVVGGEGNLARINIDRGMVASKVKHTTGTVRKLRRGGMVIGAGLDNGKVEVLDPNSLTVLKTFNAHQGPIVDIDCKGTTLVSCGYSARKSGYFPDPIVNVFDLRAMKPMAPIAFPMGAMFVRMHPKLSTCCFIAGSTGQIQILDFLRPTEVLIHQAAIATSVVGMDLSSTGDYMALSDSDGFLQLWSNDQTGESVFTEFAAPTEFPTADDPVSIDNDHPFSSVGMPYYKDELLSSWSDPIYVFDAGMPTGKVDSDIAKRARRNQSGLLFASNTKHLKRNLAQRYISLDPHRRSSVTVPKFKSEKERTGEIEDQSKLFSEAVEAGRIAKVYRRLEIKYSKFGINDFDFDFYNSTKYSGLETQLSNSYCNALIQLLRFSPAFHNFALNAVAVINTTQPSLLSEIGLLFDMLCKAEGRASKAGNFLKTLKELPEAKKLLYDDLIGPSNKSVSESVMVQELSKFVLTQVYREAGQSFLGVGAIPVTIAVKRAPCGYQSQRDDLCFGIDLATPSENGRKAPGFLQSLRRSLESWSQGGGYCEHCNEYSHISMMQSVRAFPKILPVNVSLDDSSRALWEKELSWPAEEFYVSNNRGKIMIRADDKNLGTRYELSGIVCRIGTEGDRENHLVTITNTPDGWHLFNDFLVKKIDEEEALDFRYPWKTPVLLLYEEVTGETFDQESWKQKMDTSLLYNDYFIQGQMEDYARQYKLLTQEEAPKPGTLVAMDAEFVKLQEEVIEIRSDGSKFLVVPTVLSLARVSVVRGEGPEESLPFIDDYITTTEPVVDYLTSYSGIEDGDLDPATSKKGLVTLQTAYKRLWLLLNLGCVFIGHGLHNDFRTINIQVPKSQVIDTVQLFYRPRQRHLSLKFLAWYLLDEQVQTGNHDSIEDARTALFLYRKFQQLEREGKLEQTLDIIYEEGRKYGYKPPTNAAVGGSYFGGQSAPGTPY